MTARTQDHYIATDVAREAFPRGTRRPADLDRYARAALRSELDRLETSALTGRNPSLHGAAARVGRLTAHLPREEAAQALTAAGQRMGLRGRELFRPIARGLDWGAAHPRDLDALPAAPSRGERVADVARWRATVADDSRTWDRKGKTTRRILEALGRIASERGVSRFCADFRTVALIAGVSRGTVANRVADGSLRPWLTIDLGDRITNRPSRWTLRLDANAERLAPSLPALCDPSADLWHRSSTAWAVACILEPVDALTPAQVAERAHLSPTNARRHLTRLEAQGAARRTPDGWTLGDAVPTFDRRHEAEARARIERALYRRWLAEHRASEHLPRHRRTEARAEAARRARRRRRLLAVIRGAARPRPVPIAA